ncbi:hypothetical protein EDB89DRAFT_1902019 [Lactarius sanguifluus]|nr:hypothetical protein EDB89DRAFT_1902019 [Lactarius sanguifluus]
MVIIPPLPSQTADVVQDRTVGRGKTSRSNEDFEGVASDWRICEADTPWREHAIFQGQAEAFQQFRAGGDQRLTKWISPVVGVLYKFSETLGGVAGTAFPPVGVIFTGIGILLAAAKDVRASHDALVELFERIENFFKRLGIYTQISLTTEMGEVSVKIVSEVLCILSIATKEVKRTRAITTPQLGNIFWETVGKD